MNKWKVTIRGLEDLEASAIFVVSSSNGVRISPSQAISRSLSYCFFQAALGREGGLLYGKKGNIFGNILLWIGNALRVWWGRVWEGGEGKIFI